MFNSKREWILLRCMHMLLAKTGNDNKCRCETVPGAVSKRQSVGTGRNPTDLE